MNWNWQQPNWPFFHYNSDKLQALESSFLYQSGLFLGIYTHITDSDQKIAILNLLSEEALTTSKIEGEYLERASVQASFAHHFGIATQEHPIIRPAEQGISAMITDLYHSFASPLSHEMLWEWHALLLQEPRPDLKIIGHYRAHPEPMQIISGPIGAPRIHFEAPPSESVIKEMDRFIQWFNQTAPNGAEPLPPLARASITHLYFEAIHPFEDGNGRIGRALVEKSLAQSLKHPTLLAISHILLKNRTEYYRILGMHNRTLHISVWVEYFSHMILEAQKYTHQLIHFLIEKTKLYDNLKNQLNERQEKVLSRVFKEGPNGFEGGLSAKNYITITKTSRATATRDLQDLIEKKALFKIGEQKSTRYFLNIPLEPPYGQS